MVYIKEFSALSVEIVYDIVGYLINLTYCFCAIFNKRIIIRYYLYLPLFISLGAKGLYVAFI